MYCDLNYANLSVHNVDFIHDINFLLVLGCYRLIYQFSSIVKLRLSTFVSLLA